MRRSLLVIACLVALGSCDTGTGGPSENDSATTYVFDSETKLCFTRSRTYGGYYVYNDVPCTDRVLAKIYPAGVPAEARVAQALCSLNGGNDAVSR